MSKITVQNVVEIVNRIAPRHLAEEWDNPGLLVGNPTAEVAKVFVCLDVTEGVIGNAIEVGANLIIAHHPIIFNAIKNIRTDLPLGRKLRLLIQNDIAVFAAHTNLDSAHKGVNEVLAEKLGLTDVRMFGYEEFSLGRIGRLSEAMSAKDFAEHVKTALNAKSVRLIEAGDFPITKVGVCGGAGSDVIQKAKFYGAQAFVTGDVKYHEAQNAIDNNIHVVDAGHFATEYPIVHALTELLRSEAEKLSYDIEIIEDETSADVFTTI